MYGAYVSARNAVHLGSEITCDGLPQTTLTASSARIQTHVHTDHLNDWERSLSGNIYLTPASRDLIIAETPNSSLAYRHNLKVIHADGNWNQVAGGESQFRLFSAGHMLGSCMVSAKSFNTSYFYTSDFGWPLSPDVESKLKNASHNVLVIDASYGHPEKSKRSYSQSDVSDALLMIISEEIKKRSIKIVGYRGRLQRTYRMLSTALDKEDIIFGGSENVTKSIDIYHREFGLSDEKYERDFANLTKDQQKIMLVDARDHSAVESSTNKELIITLRESRSLDSYISRTAKGYQICMTDHADFAGTINMVNLIRPTDGILTSGTYARELANYLYDEMGYEACCAEMRNKAA